MDKFKLEYKPFGRRAILIQWPRLISESILNDIIRFKKIILEHYPKLELVPAYNSLTLMSRTNLNFSSMTDSLRTLYRSNMKVPLRERKLWHIPVCYDLEFGIDLEEFSNAKKMSIERIIELHTEPIYTIYAIGFLPGFMYLGGLPEALHHPRRGKPRLHIPQGSVGIGGEQTGVYPQESPGGWNIIGNSPVKIFNPKNENPCGVNVGDKIKFYSVDKPTHELVTIQVETGIFHLKTLELDDQSS
ncbi:5-oxoprolinase subunit PxpB [Robertkochia solimangrovi]|uniref:5-oxoprolinase subunit PxpB n=1 Tax=Robertkochia solimangrovi TaxID=2213046 RepID=UPI00117FBD31|nr:5-oxoprolinase subunit PxpB [Robertkochia solimangrovi]TRZ42563.1 allophanate hydrolase subunit 1 [Robertkochia solimangrovi]